MAQFLRPDSNVTQTGFTGGFAEIDETAASDTDRAFGAADKTASVLEVGLSNPQGSPGSGTTTVRYRMAKVNSSGAVSAGGDTVTVTCAVYQGSTLIASDSARTAPDTYTTVSFTPDMSGVTDWNDLRLRFTTAESGGGSGANRRSAAISWAELEAPDAALAITGSLSAGETGTDGFSASGTVADPSITGSLNATETGSDAVAMAGAVTVAGALGATEAGADTAAMAGAVSLSGTVSASEAGSDSAAFAGMVLLSGLLDASEGGDDTASMSGTVVAVAGEIVGVLDATEPTECDELECTGKAPWRPRSHRYPTGGERRVRIRGWRVGP